MKYMAFILMLIAPSLAGAEDYDIKYSLIATFGKKQNQHSLNIKTFSTPTECEDAKSFLWQHVEDHKKYGEFLRDFELATLALNGCYTRFKSENIESNILQKFSLQELLNVNFDSEDELEELAILDQQKIKDADGEMSTSAICAGKIYYAVRKRTKLFPDISRLQEKGIKFEGFASGFAPEVLSYTCIPIIK